MEQLLRHRNHAIVGVVALVAAVVLGWGAAAALVAIAILMCMVMMGALLWVVMSGTDRWSP